MKYRKLGRTNWEISETGYGMGGMHGWFESKDEESIQSLQHAVDHGCNFFGVMVKERVKVFLENL